MAIPRAGLKQEVIGIATVSLYRANVVHRMKPPLRTLSSFLVRICDGTYRARLNSGPHTESAKSPGKRLPIALALALCRRSLLTNPLVA